MIVLPEQAVVELGAAVARHPQPLRICDSISAELHCVAQVGKSVEVGVAVKDVQKSEAERIIALYIRSVRVQTTNVFEWLSLG